MPDRVLEVVAVIVDILRQRHRPVRVVFRGEHAGVFAEALRFSPLLGPAVRKAVTVLAPHQTGQPWPAVEVYPCALTGPPVQQLPVLEELVVDARARHAHPQAPSNPVEPTPGTGKGSPRAPQGAPGRARDPDIVIDCKDPAWPAVAQVAAGLPYPDRHRLRETQAFFALRAAGWDNRFGADVPAYAQAVADADLTTGTVVADLGCGTGPALAALRAAVGLTGRVLAVDVTTEMLRSLRAGGRHRGVGLILADVLRLPLGAASLDAVFAGALFSHLPDPGRALAEMARVTRRGGRLIVFHPSGLAAIAARHGRTPGIDEPLARAPFTRLLQATGWRLRRYQDVPARFFAIAELVRPTDHPSRRERSDPAG